MASRGLVLVLWVGYRYVTRRSTLGARLVGLVEKLDLRVVGIGEVSFSPWAGLEVLDMPVAADEDSPLARRARVPNPPPLLRVPRAHVRVSPWALLLGKLRPREVELDAPVIAVIWPAADGSAPRKSCDAHHLVTPHATSAGRISISLDAGGGRLVV
ncbi:MAG: hypothetical protein ACE5I3_12530 [Phycisphaerae bacterium]